MLRISLASPIREGRAAGNKAVATQHSNVDYLISHGWLTGIENGNHVPSIFKFYTLGAIYGRTVRELVSYFNVHIGEIGREHATGFRCSEDASPGECG